MSWPAFIYRKLGPGRFDLICPNFRCNELVAEYDRKDGDRWPKELTCPECGRTAIIPVHVSRGLPNG